MWKQILLLNLLIAISIYFLITLVSLPQEELAITSRIRFFCFIGVHGVIFIEILFLSNIQGIHRKVVLNFVCCLIEVTAFTLCETNIRRIEVHPHPSYIKNNQKTQYIIQNYLVLYYITYVGSILNLITSGIYLAFTEIVIRQQEQILNQNLQSSLRSKPLADHSREEQCSICLQKMDDLQGHYVQIKACQHLFHRRCLVAWIIHHETCPLCRNNIFKPEDKELAQQ